jgi:hypothetical protein
MEWWVTLKLGLIVYIITLIALSGNTYLIKNKNIGGIIQTKFINFICESKICSFKSNP